VNNTLCSAAWTDINLDFANRVIRHCTKSAGEPFPETLTIDFFNNSDRINQTRNDLLNGIQALDCRLCWNDYKLTGNAYRDFKNKWASKNDVNSQINFIEISLDNLCDLSCIYCNEFSSSKIASEKKVKNTKNPQIVQDLQVFVLFLEDLARKQEKISLGFLGGEVTYSKNFFYFVNELLKNDVLVKSNLSFSILTNCNSNETAMKKIISLFDQMPNNWQINVSISNESIKEHSELIRYGLSWDRFVKNFITYYQHKKIKALSVTPTLTVFTVRTFPDFITTMIDLVLDLGNSKPFKVFGNWVQHPAILNPVYSNANHKELIANLKNYVKTTNVIKNNEDFIKFLDKLEDRIGSLQLDEEKLDDFLVRLAEQKSDNTILELKKLL
jgi:MoaA/NifB/PqqE/SkfB family radical SAM enzyme